VSPGKSGGNYNPGRGPGYFGYATHLPLVIAIAVKLGEELGLLGTNGDSHAAT
jgi:hypothetical protein